MTTAAGRQAKRERAAMGLVHVLRVQTEIALKKQAGGGGPMLEEYAEKQEIAKQVYAHMSQLRRLSPAAAAGRGHAHASFISTRAEAVGETRKMLDACGVSATAQDHHAAAHTAMADTPGSAVRTCRSTCGANACSPLRIFTRPAHNFGGWI